MEVLISVWFGLNHYMGWFAQHSLFGVPLDIPAHFVVGAVIFESYIRVRISFFEPANRRAELLRELFVVAFMFVFLAAISKELSDHLLYTNGSAWAESVKDIFFTMLYPMLRLDAVMKWRTDLLKDRGIDQSKAA